MKRRDFLKTGAATAGLVGTLTIEPMLGTAQNDTQAGTGAEGQSPG